MQEKPAAAIGIPVRNVSSGKRTARFLSFVRQPGALRSILVIRNGLLGDVVSITPVLMRIHSTYPEAAIDVLVSEKALPLLEGFPGVRRMFSLSAQFSLVEHTILFLHLRRYRYDVILVEEANSHYTIMSRLASAKYLCGMDNSWRFLLDAAIPRTPGLHTVDAQIETVLEWTRTTSDDRTFLAVNEEEKKAATQFLATIGISPDDYLVCIHPGCSSPNSERRWLPARYSELGDLLIEKHKAKIIFTGVQTDETEVETIRSGMKHGSVSLAGKTSLRSLMSILQRANFVIGPDTGTLHIACALHTPVVMLMGFADPLDTGPYDPRGVSRYVRVSLPCIGCATRDPKPAQWDSCKAMRPVFCMENLQTDLVLKAIEESMAAASNQQTKMVPS